MPGSLPMNKLLARAQQLELAMAPLAAMTPQIIQDDEAEAFPSEVADLIAKQQILQDFIPLECGGRLQSLTGLMAIARVLARRNLTTAIALAQTFLGVLPIWIAGNGEQKQRAAAILQGGGLNCLALTEELYGSDLQANQVLLIEADDEHYRVQGEKWCINNATRGAALTLFARHESSGRDQGFSLLLVDKAAIDTATVENIPALLTHGIRGADISGIAFNGTLIARSAVLDRPGKGLDITLRTLQISRTLCAGLSLGAGDTALRLAADYVHKRQLYGGSVASIGAVQGKLAGCYRDLLLAEAIGLVLSRACTRLPEQMSVYSALVKYLVPTMVDEQIRICGVLLGARGYLREGDYALLQKIKRDHAVVALFDGSTEVNLYVISGQLKSLLKPHAASQTYDLSWQELFALDGATPDFSGAGLKLSNRGRDVVREGLAALSELADSGVQHWCVDLLNSYHDLCQCFAEHQDGAEQMGADSFALAQAYCELTARGLYLQFWYYNRHWFTNDLMRSEHWLAFVLGDESALDHATVVAAIQHQMAAGQMFSHGEFQLATDQTGP